MIDTDRNFMPLEQLKRQIDAMHATKLNFLHWHIVDSQAFPIQVKFSPNLTMPYTPSQMYSQEDIKELVEYAWLRGVKILPEFDMPGHTAIIGKAYPEHTTCVDYVPWDGDGNGNVMCNQPPCGQLAPTQGAVDLMTQLIGEMATLFPSNLFSTGYDEVNFNCWNNATIVPKTLENRENNPEWNILQTESKEKLKFFQSGVARAVKSANKRLVVWDESFTEFGLNGTSALPEDSVLTVWAGTDQVPNITDSNDIILVPYQYWYLDCGIGTNASGPNMWCAIGPNKTINDWQRMYLFDPDSLGGNSQRILGGQSAMWSERMLPAVFDYGIWPRAAAVAERLWSPSTARNLTDAEVRLMKFNTLLYEMGLNPSPLNWTGQNFMYELLPQWCNNQTDDGTSAAMMANGDNYCAPAQTYCCGQVNLTAFSNLVNT